MPIREIIRGEGLETIITDALERMHIDGPVLLEDMEILAYIKLFHPEALRQHESRLIYLLGLFYKSDEPNNLVELAYSTIAQSILDATGHHFTPVQASVFHKISKNVNFSFSAPTSVGKSYLFRELIKNTEGDIVVIVPSRALIAEYISEVLRLVDKRVLVLDFIENVNIKKIDRRIYIITPERGPELFKIANELKLGLFLFDEAQISEEHVRGMRFDSLVRRVDRQFKYAKKVFAHPFVKNPEAQLKKHGFRKESAAIHYSQHAVGKIFVTTGVDGFQYASPYEKKRARVEIERDLVESILDGGGTILIYTSKEPLNKR